MENKISPDKQFPVKILEDLYIFGIIGSNENKREEFLKLDFFEKIEQLVSKNPLARKVRVSGTIPEFYTSAFGDFIVSPSKEKYTKEKNEEITQKESEKLFLKLKETYQKMNNYGNQMKEFVYARKTH